MFQSLRRIRETARTFRAATGDVYYTSPQQNRVFRIVWVSPSQDFAFDADIDLIDFRAFHACVARDPLARSKCHPFDANADNDVDPFDFKALVDALDDG